MVFFHPRNRKYANGNRPDRAAGNAGYWKPTRCEKKIKANNGFEIDGTKRSLDFYANISSHRNAGRTDRKMHEYVLHNHNIPSGTDAMQLNNFVLCTIYKSKRKNQNNGIPIEPEVMNGKQQNQGSTMQTEDNVSSGQLHDIVINGSYMVKGKCDEVVSLNDHMEVEEPIVVRDNVEDRVSVQVAAENGIHGSEEYDIDAFLDLEAIEDLPELGSFDEAQRLDNSSTNNKLF